MTHRHFRVMRAGGLLLALMIVAGLAGCGTGAGGAYGLGSSSTSAANAGSSQAQTTCASSTAPICTRSVMVNGSSETVLVTSSGRTLYYFTTDTATQVACVGTCVADWTPLLSSSATVQPIAGLSGTLATVQRKEGFQITFNGWPVYTFTSDKAPGDAKGDGLNGQGVKGVWYVARSSLAPSNGSGSGGYGY